jgi:hypothetical protein
MFEENLVKAIDDKSQELAEEVNSLIESLSKNSPGSAKVKAMIDQADSLDQSGDHFESLKVYTEALKQYRNEKEEQKSLSLNAYRFIVRQLDKIGEFMEDLDDGAIKLEEGQISPALNSYERSVGIDFAPGRNIVERAMLRLHELKAS